MAQLILSAASSFALEAHGEQKYGRKPYHVHLLDVVNVLRRFYDWDELPQEYIDAAWLHDVVEDTLVTIDRIDVNFGPRVAALVLAVTKPVGMSSKTAQEQELYKRIRDTSGAINIKLADRIANVEQCISFGRVGRKPHRLFEKYARSWPEFQASLRGRCGGEGYSAYEMWEHLDMLFDLGEEARSVQEVMA